MNDETKNIKTVVGFFDGLLGGYLNLGSSLVVLLVLATIPMLILWGILWVLNAIGIV